MTVLLAEIGARGEPVVERAGHVSYDADERGELPREGVGSRAPLNRLDDAAGRVVHFEQERELLLPVRGHGRAYEAGVYRGDGDAAVAKVYAHALEEGRDRGLARA